MIVQKLAEHIVYTDFNSLNDSVVDDAKKRLIDVVGCVISGTNEPSNRIILDVIRNWCGSKEATILVYGDKVLLHDAVMVNSILARSYDYEVCGPEATGKAKGRMTTHICGTTDTTGLSVGEYAKASGKDLITAIVLGADIAARFAVTEDFDWKHGFERTGTVNAFGASTVAGRILGLNVPEIINAFGILLDEIAGSSQSIWDGSYSFKLPQGFAARNALIAIELTRQGFQSVADPLFSPYGYFNQYCKDYNAEYLMNNLGKHYYSQGQHKIYPSCYGTHTAIECALEIVRRYHIDTVDIAEVNIDVNQSRYNSFLNRDFHIGDSEVHALFSLQYSTANALLRGKADTDHYSRESMDAPEIHELLKKVNILPILDTENKYAVHLRVRMHDGNEYSESRDIPVGWVDNPVSMEAIKEKFCKNVATVHEYSKVKAAKALEMLENLEEVKNIADIVDLLKI